MATYEVGQTIVFGLHTYDADNDLADVGTGPTATVTLPDATTATATVTKTATGAYTGTLVATTLGRHVCRWEGSGANSGGLPYVDVAEVADFSRQIISLAEARNALNMTAGQTVDDDELRGYLLAATTVVEHIRGPVLVDTVAEIRTGGGRPALALSDYPTSVVSVVEDGTALTEGSGYCWDESGVLWRGSEPFAGAWSRKPRGVVVTYVVGSGEVPAHVRQGAALLVRHWWNQTQQSYRPFGTDYSAPQTTTLAGYAVPNFVADMLAPGSVKPPGIG